MSKNQPFLLFNSRFLLPHEVSPTLRVLFSQQEYSLNKNKPWTHRDFCCFFNYSLGSDASEVTPVSFFSHLVSLQTPSVDFCWSFPRLCKKNRVINSSQKWKLEKCCDERLHAVVSSDASEQNRQPTLQTDED